MSFEDELSTIANEDVRAATLDETVNDEESASTIHWSTVPTASTSITAGNDLVANMAPGSRKIQIADGLCYKDQARSVIRPDEQQTRPSIRQHGDVSTLTASRPSTAVAEFLHEENVLPEDIRLVEAVPVPVSMEEVVSQQPKGRQRRRNWIGLGLMLCLTLLVMGVIMIVVLIGLVAVDGGSDDGLSNPTKTSPTMAPATIFAPPLVPWSMLGVSNITSFLSPSQVEDEDIVMQSFIMNHPGTVLAITFETRGTVGNGAKYTTNTFIRVYKRTGSTNQWKQLGSVSGSTTDSQEPFNFKPCWTTFSGAREHEQNSMET